MYLKEICHCNFYNLFVWKYYRYFPICKNFRYFCHTLIIIIASSSSCCLTIAALFPLISSVLAYSLIHYTFVYSFCVLSRSFFDPLIFVPIIPPIFIVVLNNFSLLLYKWSRLDRLFLTRVLLEQNC